MGIFGFGKSEDVPKDKKGSEETNNKETVKNSEAVVAKMTEMITFAKNQRLDGMVKARAIADAFLNDKERVSLLTKELVQLASGTPYAPRDRFHDIVRRHAYQVIPDDLRDEVENFSTGLMEVFGGSPGKNGFVDLNSLT